MSSIDLADYGFPGAIFEYQGQIIGQQKKGDRLLFLFNEQHTNESMIRRNIKNAFFLYDLGIISCVGVEEYPYRFQGKGEHDVAEMSSIWFERYNDADGIIDRSYEFSRPNLPFGMTLKLLRPTIKVSTVENDSLHKQCENIRDDFLYRLAMTQDLIAADRLRREFEEHPINLQRDEAFLRGMLEWWHENGTEKAAILNAGASHQQRIVRQLPPDIRFIYLDAATAK
jgi:hypothetical protein